jgi:DNA replication protein DnaC
MPGQISSTPLTYSQHSSRSPQLSKTGSPAAPSKIPSIATPLLEIPLSPTPLRESYREQLANTLLKIAIVIAEPDVETAYRKEVLIDAIEWMKNGNDVQGKCIQATRQMLDSFAKQRYLPDTTHMTIEGLKKALEVAFDKFGESSIFQETAINILECNVKEICAGKRTNAVGDNRPGSTIETLCYGMSTDKSLAPSLPSRIPFKFKRSFIDASPRIRYRKSPARPIYIRPSFNQNQLSKLQSLNADPDILYWRDLIQRPDGRELDRQITEKVGLYGFKRNEKEYWYKGDSPATALRNLLTVRPLALDCASALNLVTAQSLLDSLGDAQFSTYIKKACIDILSIGALNSLPIYSDEIYYYHAGHEQTENPLPANVKDGDGLYVLGPSDGFAFHPESDLNGFNVRVATNGSTEPLLWGFESAGRGCWTYAELQKLLSEAYRQPLTFGDLIIILSKRKDKAPVPYSTYTYHDVCEWLAKNQAKALMKAIVSLRHGNMDPNQKTEIYPTPFEAIRGVVKHDRIRDSLSLEDLMYGKVKLSTVPLHPAISPERNFGDLLPGFISDLPHQRHIYAAAEDFYKRCVNASGHKAETQFFDGMLLYGNAGTGKTMACKALLNRLQEKKYVVWKTDFSESNALLSYEQEKRLLTIFADKDIDAYYAALIEIFEPAWKHADILFVDDTNLKHDALNGVSNALVRYARKMAEQGIGKKVLITCNSDPVEGFQSSITFPVDSISIRHIEGPDHRAEKAWYRTIKPGNYPVPKQLSYFVPTENQQLMQQWLEALRSSTGHNGVAFYGQPGIGKTTALKEYFSASALTALWMEAHTLTGRTNLLERLAASEEEYLVIDDCNDPKDNYRYRKVLFSLLNHEALWNKNGVAVKVVLVSNRENWQALVNDAATGKMLLSARMNSRYTGRFASIALAGDRDFRANLAKRGVISTSEENISIAISEQAYRLSLNGYSEDRSYLVRVMTAYSPIRPAQTSADELWGLRTLQLTPAQQEKYDKANHSLQDFITDTLKDIDNPYGVILEYDVEEETLQTYSVWYSQIIQQVLDVMDARPDAAIVIISRNPEKTMASLQKMMTKADKTDKYLSRLQLFSIQS